MAALYPTSLVLASSLALVAGVCFAVAWLFAPFTRRGAPPPQSQSQRRGRAHLVRLPLNYTTVVATIWPVAGLLLCLLLSVMRNYRSVTHTSCGAVNFMPSISATIGDFAPQRYVWRTAVAMYIWQRLLSGPVMHRLFDLAVVCPSGRGSGAVLNHARAAAHTAEQLFLVLLSYVSSSDDLVLHELGFTGFCAFGSLNMLLTCALCRRWVAAAAAEAAEAGGRRAVGDTRLGPDVAELSVAWRTRATGINFMFLAGACSCFGVHQAYCPDFVYSLFGLFEWCYVLSNIAFHCSEVAELRHFDIAVLAQDKEGFRRLSV